MTTYRQFRAGRSVADARRRCGLKDLKIVLITNASMFHARVRRGLSCSIATTARFGLLDAGMRLLLLVARSAVPFS